MILKQAAFYPAVARYGYDLDQFPFDDAYLDRLLGFLGQSRETVDLDRFALDHFNLFYTYLQAKQAQAAFPGIEQENKALAKVQDLARKLAEALGEIQRTGEAGNRLLEDAKDLPRQAFRLHDLTLADFASGPPQEPFRPFNELLYDLRTALQRAKIEKPRPVIPPMNGGGLGDQERADLWTRFSAQSDDMEARFLDRRAKRRRAANPALTSFALHLWEIFPKYSDRRFTEGRYEKDIHSYNSSIIDFAETCLIAFGAKYTPNLIGKKLRDVREAAQRVMASGEMS